jgi:predicted regulator of Ras-like GTPase activity (Roadblock/LC7/MglB family)
MSTSTSPLRLLCTRHLQLLKQTADNLKLAVVSSTDGFPIALIDVELQPGRKATAMAAALDGLSKSIVKEFGLGALEGTVLETEQGLVLCRRVHGPKYNLVLLAVMGKDTTYGHALWAIKNAAKELTASLQELTELDPLLT